jgi:hypothetical protein
MKNLSYITISVMLLLSACTKSGIVDDTGDVNTALGSPVWPGAPLTYSQISGTYVLFDSIHFVGNGAAQYVYADSTHPVHKPIVVTIDSATASFMFEGQLYRETRNVRNQYQCNDTFFRDKIFRFVKDSVYINYYKTEYAHDSILSISFKGYKVK